MAALARWQARPRHRVRWVQWVRIGWAGFDPWSRASWALGSRAVDECGGKKHEHEPNHFRLIRESPTSV